MTWHTLVSAETAASHLADPRLIIFDCRHDLMRPEAGREAFRNGHLPGARYADMNHDLAAPPTPRTGRHPLPDPAGFAARLRDWGVRDDSLLLAYDDGAGLWAARLWWMTARWLGHDQAAVLDGGLRRWRELGLPTTAATAPPRPAGNFVGRLRDSAVADADEVAETARDSARRVLDARAPERFRGEVEPIDPVAGHVPGARNHPAVTSVDTEGRWRRPAELAAALARSLDDTAPADAIAMCGSGVTACHLLLALEVAGLPGARLYPGSWSEWSRDPSRPIARGRRP